MKAEQRKELETNTLADKMGRAVQRVKASPRRTFVTYALVIAAVIVAAFLCYRWYYQDVEKRSFQWIVFYDGTGKQIEALANSQDTKETSAGKAARFQFAWYDYWHEGIKMAGANPASAMTRIRAAKQQYEGLIIDCKEDPVYLPQAMLGRAVCTESLAAQDLANLDKAKEYYKELAEDEKYGKQAEGLFAKDRLEILNDTKVKGAALRESYRELNEILRIPAVQERRPIPDKAKGRPLIGEP